MCMYLILSIFSHFAFVHFPKENLGVITPTAGRRSSSPTGQHARSWGGRRIQPRWTGYWFLLSFSISVRFLLWSLINLIYPSADSSWLNVSIFPENWKFLILVYFCNFAQVRNPCAGSPRMVITNFGHGPYKIYRLSQDRTWVVRKSAKNRAELSRARNCTG